MIFTELVLENFGAYAGNNVINLRPENNGSMHPIILLGGMNGGGKTTLLDAIRLALYGYRAKCSTRGKLSYADFLKESVNGKAVSADVTKIELSFEYIFEGNWQQFKIVRAWNRDVKNNRDSLSVKREGIFDRNLEENWDEYIENILPLGISNLFLFDGEQVKDLAELETPPPAVIDAVNNLLGLELSEKLAVDLEVLVKRKRKSWANKEQLTSIEDIEEKLAEKKQARETAVSQLDELQILLEKANKKRDRARNKFKKEGGKVTAEEEILKATVDRIDNDLNDKRAELRDIAGGSLPLGLISSLLVDASDRGKEEIENNKFKQAQFIIRDRDTKLLGYLQDIALNKEVINKVGFFISEQNKIIDESAAASKDNYLDINETELQQLITIKDNLKFQQKAANDNINKLQELEIEKDNAEQKLARRASKEDYKKLDSALQIAIEEVSNAKIKYETAEKKIEELDKQIDRLEQELNRKLKNISTDAIDRDNDEHIINSVEKVQETLKLFREKLTERKLNKLETEVTNCFRYLLHKSNLVHRVVIESNTFRLSLYDTQGEMLPKQRLSAGEKQLLAIAFLWGLARVSGRNLPIAIDTPLGRLDSSHRANLIDRYFPSASHQVILLSTDTEIGKEEIIKLRESDAIAQEYLLDYNADKSQTTVKPGYFW